MGLVINPEPPSAERLDKNTVVVRVPLDSEFVSEASAEEVGSYVKQEAEVLLLTLKLEES